MTYPTVNITLTLQQVLDFVQQLPQDYQVALLAMLMTQQAEYAVQKASEKYAVLRGTLDTKVYQRNTAQSWENVEKQAFFTDETDEVIDNAVANLS